MEKKEKQELIDLMFQLVLVATSDKKFCKKPRGERMAWVANQLREMGYDTHPIGMTWGTLVSEEFQKKVPIETDNLEK
jgi:hypothetical protein